MSGDGPGYRTSQKNIGVEFSKITTDLRALLDDCRYWVEHNTYPPDEIAARFHHRLVAIHCYVSQKGCETIRGAFAYEGFRLKHADGEAARAVRRGQP